MPFLVFTADIFSSNILSDEYYVFPVDAPSTMCLDVLQVSAVAHGYICMDVFTHCMLYSAANNVKISPVTVACRGGATVLWFRASI